MTDDATPNNKAQPLTMPPGFRWEPNPNSRDGYGFLTHSDLDVHSLAYHVQESAIEIAHALVRPAVEAATAELRARAEKAEALLAAVVAEAEACEDETWICEEADEAVRTACRGILAAASRGEGE